jgi:excisionase family DNA binding protein
MPENLTTTAAASVLGVSRPTLMKMIKRHEIPAHKVGSHSRLRTEDVLAARTARRSKQRQAFDALRALEDQEN